MLLHKTFIVKPSMNCNLRCKYCYEFNNNGDCYGNDHLDIENFERFIGRTARLYPDSRVLWLLHGGEPLVNGVEYLERFIACIRKARETCGVDFQLALQTNATLLTDPCIRVLEDNIDLLSERVVSISIDGPKEINDQVRVNASAESSFSRTVEGVRRIQNSKLDFSTITVVGAHNVDSPNEVYSFIKQLGSRLCKFIPCYNYSAEGNCEKFGINPIKYSQFICRVFDLWMHDLPGTDPDRWLVIDPIATVLAKLSKVFVTWCEYRDEKCDNFVCLYPNGELWLCDTMDHSSMRSKGFVGNINTMTDDEFTRAITAPCKVCSYSEFYSGAMEKCKTCDILNLCKGGCLPMREIIKKKSDRVYGDYCQAKHILFDYIKKAAERALP